jgi:predicted ribosome quality control (RQC) complex YloA/Tae2 family protein
MSTKMALAGRAMKTASAQIRKFESESQILKSKIAQLEEKLKDTEKEAEARKLALDLLLDEDTARMVQDKTASLKGKNLTVVKEAIAMGFGEKMASIGEVASTSSVAGIDSTNPVKAAIAMMERK